jgi:predicted glutamine amidotransferase
MCQILAMSCKIPATINFSLEGFSARGGLTDEYADGCGIAFYKSDGWHIYKDTNPASTSSIIDYLKSSHIKSSVVIAHIRKATKGSVDLNNCHPFKRSLWGKEWVFAHNGDLKNFNPVINGDYRVVGDTDSELAFCYILQALSCAFLDAGTGNKPSTRELFSELTKLSQELSYYGTFNITISDGSFIFAYCSTSLSYLIRKPPFCRASLIDTDLCIDFDRLNTDMDQMALITTKPLTSDENWTPFLPGESLMFIDGECLDKLALF